MIISCCYARDRILFIVHCVRFAFLHTIASFNATCYCLHYFRGVGDDVIVTSSSGSLQITRQGFQFKLAQFFVSSSSASSLGYYLLD